MSRRKSRKLTAHTNKLKVALEAGKKVEGITGYVETNLKSDYYDSEHSKVIMKVKCTRVVAGNKDFCGVKVMAKPFSGSGEFEVNICNWFDTVAKYKKTLEYGVRVSEATEFLSSLFCSDLVTVTKDNCIDFLQSSKKETVAIVRRELEETNDKVTETTPIKSLFRNVNRSKLKDVMAHVVAKQYRVLVKDMEIQYM